MKEKAIASTITLIASLVTYHYAKGTGKDVVPYVMIGGFIGALVGDVIAQEITKQDK